jgi:hypothetical protein
VDSTTLFKNIFHTWTSKRRKLERTRKMEDPSWYLPCYPQAIFHSKYTCWDHFGFCMKTSETSAYGCFIHHWKGECVSAEVSITASSGDTALSTDSTPLSTDLLEKTTVAVLVSKLTSYITWRFFSFCKRACQCIYPEPDESTLNTSNSLKSHLHLTHPDALSRKTFLSCEVFR